MEELRQSLIDSFCNRRIRIEGLVDRVQTGGDGVVLRSLHGDTTRFTPINYEGGILIFFLLEGSMELTTTRNGVLPITMVLVTDRYDDYKTAIDSFDTYSFKDLRIEFGDLNNYLEYFNSNENKPFQNHCFKINFTITENYKFCCDPYIGLPQVC